MLINPIRYCEIEEYRRKGFIIGSKTGAGLYEVTPPDPNYQPPPPPELISRPQPEPAPLPPPPKPVDNSGELTVILQLVASHFGYTRADLFSSSRLQMLAFARQTFCWVASESGFRNIEIARFLHKDHTTITHALAKIDRLRNQDHGIRTLTNRLLHEVVRKEQNGQS